jgi:hypothetical protein
VKEHSLPAKEFPCAVQENRLRAKEHRLPVQGRSLSAMDWCLPGSGAGSEYVGAARGSAVANARDLESWL